MNNCQWCGKDYEWSDRIASALCEDCAADEAGDNAAEALMEERWGQTMAEDIAFLLKL
jgi:hypothetical protein